jgi:ectoine hydroxylase-related dioxygenase (phytanoyl-CoA dioxygenase family)
MFYFKPPGARGQSLHQDNFYLRVQPGTCLGVWIAVDDSTLENGCMIVAPRSHQLPVLCPEAADTSLFFTEEQVAIPQGLQETPIPMQAGDALFFNGSLIHGSYPNRTPDQFRRAFTCHYVPRASAEASHWFNPYFAFDGSEVWIKEAEGGGPCGITQERINAFHG